MSGVAVSPANPQIATSAQQGALSAIKPSKYFAPVSADRRAVRARHHLQSLYQEASCHHLFFQVSYQIPAGSLSQIQEVTAPDPVAIL